MHNYRPQIRYFRKKVEDFEGIYQENLKAIALTSKVAAVIFGAGCAQEANTSGNENYNT